MGKKPSYEELEQRVKTLENEALECNNREEMYRVLVEHSLQGIVIIQNAHIAFANRAFAELSGYTIDELLSLSPDQVRALIHPDDQAMVWGRFQARLEGKPVPPRYEYRGIRKDGTVRWLEMVTSRIELLGKFAIQGSIIDVTERKHAEDALRENKEELELIFHGVREGIAIFDKTGKIIRINKRIVDVGGYSEKEIINKRLAFLKMFPRKSIIKMARNFTKLISGEITSCFEVEVYTKTGKKLDVELQGFPLRKNDKIIGMMGVIRDITERKRMETTIKESERQKETILDSLVEHVIHQDMDMKIQWANHAACESAGMTREELIGRYCYEIWPQRSDPCPDCPVRDAINTGQPQEIEKITPDGRAWYIRGYPVRDQKGTIVGGTELTLEITEHRLAEEALEKSEERYRSLFDRLPLGVFRSTPDGQFLDANPAFTRLLRCPDLTTLLKTPATTFYREPEKREEWKKLIEKGDDFAMEVQWQTLDGSPIWVYESARAVRDSQGRILYYEGVAEDITEIKRAEEKQKNMEAQLHQAQKMETLGTLVAGVAHEINNPINLIMFNIPLFQKVWHDFLPILRVHTSKEPDRKYGGLTYDFLQENLNTLLSDMKMASKQISKIVADLKTFARQSNVADRQPIQINTAVEKAVRLAQTNIRKSGIDLELDIVHDLPLIEGSSQSIEQIVLNLLINAIQAIDHNQGKVTIKTRFQKKDGRIFISISDNGRGIDPSISDKIFEPFFTDKQTEGGTGLGLSITYNLVNSHQGEITFKSKKGNGTTFNVFFPTTSIQKTAKILVVDDDKSIRDVLTEVLTREQTYQVDEASNGIEACIKLGSFCPNLLILDIFMPEMDGLEVLRTIQAEPDLSDMQVIITTGFPDHPKLKEVAEMGFTNIFIKPIKLQDILKEVDTVFNIESKE